MNLTLNFKQLNKSNADIAGGKGASLGEMTNAGIPVPPGFVILSTTFDEFIKQADLVQEIDSIIHKVDHKQISTVDQASERIQSLIKNAVMPEAIAKEIKKQFKELDTEFVAVRSSATAEDGADNAWAGQLDSFLNTKEDNVLEKVQYCWASLFTPRAIFYRFEKGLHNTKISVAVVVQKMVNSEVSGIAFSVHPVTEDRNQMIIEAGFGLGEAIVSGQVTPDSYVIEKNPRKIIDINVSTQTRGIYRVSTGGNEWIDICEPQASSQVLTNPQILEFADLIMRIENHYGFPCDIEWAFEKNKFYIVQSRPITTLQKKEIPTSEGVCVGDGGLKNTTGKELEFYYKYKWQVAANDFNSPAIRNDFWTAAFEKQAKEFKIPQAILGIVSRENRLEYIADMNTWTVTNQVVRKYIEKDIYYVEKIIDKTNQLGEDFNKWSEKNIFNNDLSKLDNEKIISLLGKFAEKQITIYAYGTVLPLIDFHNFSFVEGNLKKFLIEKVGEKNFTSYFEIFTEPLHNSFALDQEEDLLRLVQKFYTKDFVEFVKNNNLEKMKTTYPKFYEELVKHASKHGWVYYVYMGPAFTEENFLEFIKDYLNKDINPTKRLAELSEKRKTTDSLRKKYIVELKPDEFNTMIINLAGKMVWAKPRRKDYQSKSYFHLEKLLVEISKRLKLTLDQIRSASLVMIEDGLRNSFIDAKRLDDIKKFHIVLPKEGGGTLLISGDEASNFYNRNFSKEESKIENGLKEIIGTTACRGKAKGIAKLINEPSEMGKMNQGDILISVATTPSIVPVMKKAAAIVTDEGGLTCHAAIVSRELGTPCVIGTKNASKIIKDGDLIEVDADKGIVKIIERAEINSDLVKKKFKTKFPGKLILGNQDIDISWMNLEVIWSGMLDKRVSKRFGLEYPKCLCELIKGKTVNLYVESDGLKNYIKLSAEKIISDKTLLDEYKSKTIETSKKIRDFALEYIDKLDNLPISKIVEILPQIKTLQAECMIYGTVVAFADVFGDISNKTTEILCKRGKLKYPSHIYSKVLSFSDKTLTQQAYEDIKASKLSEKKLIKKYFWLDQGYIGRGLTKEKLLEIKNHKIVPEKNPSEKELLEELKLSKEEKRFFEISKDLILIKSLRADSRQYLNVVVSRLIDKIAVELQIEVKYLETLYTEELCELLKGDKTVLDNIKERYEYSVLVANKSSDYEIITGEEAKSFLGSRLLNENTEKRDEIKGQVANPGLVQGIVKLVFGPQHIDKVNEGDVLVSIATSPQLLPAMKKAVAFITDVGGITSHAAIVSRELSKPCIVGTKNATSVLKDGDLIEVDADKGIVKILGHKEGNDSSASTGDLFSEYVRELEGQKIYSPINNISLFVEGAGWNSSKFFKEFYDNPEPHPMYITSKGNEGVAVLPYNILHTMAEQTFKKCLVNADLLDEIDTYYNKGSKKVDGWYDKFNYDYVSKTASDKLLAELDVIKDVAFYTHTRVLFSAIFDEDLCKKWLKEIGVKIDEKIISKIWPKATVAVEESFDKRRLINYLTLISDKKNKKEDILEKCQYYPVGHNKVPSLGEVDEYLKKTYSNYSNAKEIKKTLEDLKTEKKKRRRDLESLLSGLDEKYKNIVSYIQFIIEKRDIRKDITGKYFTLVFRVAQKLCKEAGISEKHIVNLAYDDIRKGVDYLKKNKDSIVKRTDGFSALIHPDGTADFEYGSFEKDKKLINDLYLKQTETKGFSKDIITGKTGSPGKVTGIVKVIRNVEIDGPKLKDGEILVTGMTRPDFIPLMNKASAFVTDEGGVTCHAAIVGREMGKPSVIGTKIATHILKDGDLVEVDADKGVVKIIERGDIAGQKGYTPNGEMLITRSRPKKVCDLFPAVFTQEYVATEDMEKLYGVKAHATIYTWIGDDVTTATDTNEEFEKIGSVFVERFIRDSKWLDKIIKWSEKVKYSLRDFVEKEFSPKKMLSMSDKTLAEKYTQYSQMYIDYHLKNTPLWWIGMPAIEREFEKYVKDGKISSENLSLLIESLSYPFDLTQEELGLLKIAGMMKKNNIAIDDKLPKNIEKLLSEHISRFSSIPFAYKNYVLWDKKHFLNKIKEIVSEVDPVKELKRKETELKDKLEKQQKLFKKLNLDRRLKSLIVATHKLGYLQDLKKVFQTTSHPYLQTVIAPEMMKRLKVDRKYFGSLSPIEIKDGLLNGGLDEKIIKELPVRLENSILIARDKKYEWILGDEAVSFAKKYGFIVSTDSVKELKGNSASSGKVRGIVKVCITSHDISKVNKGDILVASMTTPDYVPAMKKAGAIVTDEGGITCHAAIVGRELNLPCVIATKNATKVLKDGDLVEVDANRGIVTIIK